LDIIPPENLAKRRKERRSCRFCRKTVELRGPNAKLEPYTVQSYYPMQRSLFMSMYIGEALVGEGNEIAHIDLLIGSKDGPVGIAFANALANQSAGHSNLLAVITPNLICKPATVMITKVTIKGVKQAVQMFGPAQAAVARAVADSTAAGIIPQHLADNF